jgi:hypothetical protein
VAFVLCAIDDDWAPDLQSVGYVFWCFVEIVKAPIDSESKLSFREEKSANVSAYIRTMKELRHHQTVTMPMGCSLSGLSVSLWRVRKKQKARYWENSGGFLL